jgi:hypothetical protein
MKEKEQKEYKFWAGHENTFIEFMALPVNE